MYIFTRSKQYLSSEDIIPTMRIPIYIVKIGIAVCLVNLFNETKILKLGNKNLKTEFIIST